jgi:hypothetical protein
MGLVRLEGLGKLKKFIDFIGSRTSDLPACSIVPKKTPWPESASELYRPSDRRLSAK